MKKYIALGAVFFFIVAASIFGIEYFSRQQSNQDSYKTNQQGKSAQGGSDSVGEDKSMNGKKQYDHAPAMTIDVKKTYTATMTTSKGVMKIVLDPSEAPMTVNNFVFLSREKFYDNTIFHRIISGFMIQGGDPLGNGMGGPGYKFEDEPVMKDYTRGSIAMANSGPDTNGSQFFIMHADYGLPKNYTIFGSIDLSDTESLKTLDAIAATPVVDGGFGEKSKPQEKVTVQSVTIEEK